MLFNLYGSACLEVVKGVLCPICKKPVEWAGNPYRPFCSERCKLIDLGEWAEEGYKISGGEDDDERPDEDGPEEQRGG